MTTSPDLPTRLREAADDITFTGRPDPHDDKALLREAAERIERLTLANVGERALLAAQERAAVAADPLRFLAEIERAWSYRCADLGLCGHYDGPEEGAVHRMFKRMMAQEDELRAERTALARFIIDNFAEENGAVVVMDGVRLVNGRKIDDAALLKLEPGRDPEPSETVAKMAIDRLQLALDRGAFASDWSELDSLLGRLEDVKVGLMDPSKNAVQAAIDALKMRRPVPPVDLSEPAAEVVAFNADESALNARNLVAMLAAQLTAIETWAHDDMLEDVEPALIKAREAVEGLDQLTRDMQPGEDGPVTARGEPLDDVTPADEHPDLMELGERARASAKNLNDRERDPGFFESDAAIAATLLREVADALAPVDEGSAA